MSNEEIMTKLDKIIELLSQTVTKEFGETKFEPEPKDFYLGEKGFVAIEPKEKPTGETSVDETVTGKVALITDKAVLIGDGDKVAWFPKSVITNLDKIVLKKDTIVELIIQDWFKYKIEWKVDTNG